MVALVIGALLITVIMRMVTGQTRFASVQTAREEVQQNARGALEMVGSEIRGAMPASLVNATATQLELRLPRAWGIVCTDGPTADVVFPDVPDLAFPAHGAGSGLMVFRAGAWVPTTYTQAPASFNPATCGGGTTPQGVGWRFNNGGGAPAPFVQGELVMVYELVRYAVAEQGGDHWLQRSLGWTGTTPNMQPLAGPVDPDAVRFRYLDAAQAEMSPVPGTTAAQLLNVRLIRFDVRTLSRQRLDGSIRQEEEGSVTVKLRNP